MKAMMKHKRLSLSDEAVSRLIDPRTGERLRPLGVVGGRTVWPMMGASPDDPSEGGSGDPDDDPDDPEGQKDKSEGGDGSDKGDPQAKITALTEEKERQYTRRKEAERRAEEAEARLREIEDKDKTEGERTAARVTELESENSVLQDLLKQSRLENAFLQDNTYDWHNPGRAMALADLSEVEIEDDGKVVGLKAALDRLVKSDPYLIKDKGPDDPGKDEPDVQNPDSRKKKDRGNSEAERDKALQQKYPALFR